MSDSSASPPARPASPFRLNLEQQRKRAKDLLKALRAGEAEALRRFRRHHPRCSSSRSAGAGDVAVRLSDAQLTDLMVQDMVERLRQAAQPVFTGAFIDDDRHWPHELLTITPLGRAILAGDVDWLSFAPAARWVGGVEIPGSPPCWRWHEDDASVVIR